MCPSHSRHGSSLTPTAGINRRTHVEMRDAIVSVTQSSSAVRLVSKQQHTTVTLLVLCQQSPGSRYSQLIVVSLKVMGF